MSHSTEITNLFDRDWDVAIILDACRYDLMQGVAPEYEFIEDVGSIYSVAAQSKEWMKTTFSDIHAEKLCETAVVTGNPYSEGQLEASKLQHLDEVWKYAWDDDIGTVPARPITNRAIGYGREHSVSRLLVHYMQPHFPCVPEPRPSSGIEFDEFGSKRMPIWQAIENGTITIEQVWSAALRNLQYVLDDVALLLENIDAEKVVITADHGDAYGENGELGHRQGSIIDPVRKVPWVVTTAIDGRTHEPEEYDAEEQHLDQDEALQVLGYQN